jgi:signal transduction histidine kinase
VSVDAELCAAGVRITVEDTGGGATTPVRGRRDARHGHGLAIVSRVAAEHGGRFQMRRTAAGASATLELPLAPRAMPVRCPSFGHRDVRADAEAPPLRAAA